MKRLFQGIQAVTVELLGVLLVVWMLFGFTAMGLHSASGQPPTLGTNFSQSLIAWKAQLSTRLFRKSPPNAERQQFVANRLGHFSQTYSLAARNHIDQLMGDFDRTTRVASRYGATSE